MHAHTSFFGAILVAVLAAGVALDSYRAGPAPSQAPTWRAGTAVPGMAEQFADEKQRARVEELPAQF